MYATTLPGAPKGLSIATHTFLIVKDNRNEIIGYFAYGSEYDGIKGSIMGRLVQRQYYQDLEIAKGHDKQHLKKEIQITPPYGMSIEEFDKRVIDVAKSFGNNEGITYFMLPTRDIEGNCNTSTSTILIKAGILPEQINKIESQMPGNHYGFSAQPRPWTKEEQEEAVKEEQQKLIKETERFQEFR